MTTIRERDTRAIHGDSMSAEEMQTITDRGDLLVVLDQLVEAAREVADYLTADPLQTVVPDGRVRALRAAIAQAKEASDG